VHEATAGVEDDVLLVVRGGLDDLDAASLGAGRGARERLRLEHDVDGDGFQGAGGSE
jgi:hypothetical protein